MKELIRKSFDSINYIDGTILELLLRALRTKKIALRRIKA